MCLACGKVEPLEKKESASSLLGEAGWCRMEEIKENHFLVSRIQFISSHKVQLRQIEVTSEAPPDFHPFKSEKNVSRIQWLSGRTYADYNIQKRLMENGLTQHAHLKDVPNCFEATEALELEFEKSGTAIFYPCDDYSRDFNQ